MSTTTLTKPTPAVAATYKVAADPMLRIWAEKGDPLAQRELKLRLARAAMGSAR